MDGGHLPWWWWTVVEHWAEYGSHRGFIHAAYIPVSTLRGYLGPRLSAELVLPLTSEKLRPVSASPGCLYNLITIWSSCRHPLTVAAWIIVRLLLPFKRMKNRPLPPYLASSVALWLPIGTSNVCLTLDQWSSFLWALASQDVLFISLISHMFFPLWRHT